jgi:hypothetical protein
VDQRPDEHPVGNNANAVSFDAVQELSYYLERASDSLKFRFSLFKSEIQVEWINGSPSPNGFWTEAFNHFLIAQSFSSANIDFTEPFRGKQGNTQSPCDYLGSLMCTSEVTRQQNFERGTLRAHG